MSEVERVRSGFPDELAKLLDLVPCPYVPHQHFDDAELFCDIQECSSCPMRFKYCQDEFLEKLREAEKWE